MTDLENTPHAASMKGAQKAPACPTCLDGSAICVCSAFAKADTATEDLYGADARWQVSRHTGRPELPGARRGAPAASASGCSDGEVAG